eukprot:m.134462 g.134462  ORF g.134462 m.134462 type:complete len:855 (+) comp11387_c1_seq1:141-2705(+)
MIRRTLGCTQCRRRWKAGHSLPRHWWMYPCLAMVLWYPADSAAHDTHSRDVRMEGVGSMNEASTTDRAWDTLYRYPNIHRADRDEGLTWDDAHCQGDLSTLPAVVQENCHPGQNSTVWDVNGAGDWSIQGFATAISALPGQDMVFKIKTPSTRYRIDIFRMGFYRGAGARRVARIRPNIPLPQRQPDCLEDNTTHLVDCGNWRVSATWKVPRDAVSGLYVARPTREDDGVADEPRHWRADLGRIQGDRLHARPGVDPFDPPANEPHAYGANGMGAFRTALVEPRASHIWFVVRQFPGTDAVTGRQRSNVVVQTSDPTWHAYNGYGGFTTYGSFASPYTHGPNKRYMTEEESIVRAYKRSYNTPLITRDYRPVNMPLNAEYPLIRFLEANGYDVAYTTGVDVAFRDGELDGHNLFISVGHDEYWSGAQRQAVTAARDRGLHLAFLSGNEVYWKTRYETSQADEGAHRTMVVYKDSQSTAALDPVEWTGTWRDARSINKEGGRPENELTGTLFTVNAQRVDALEVPSTFRQFRQWRNTKISELRPGEVYTTFKGVLGHEWDEDLDNGHRPEGQIRFSETTVDNVQYIQDHGSVFDTGTATHHLTLHKMPGSGAHVFGAGTVQWVWALDPHHDPNDPPRANAYAIRVERDPSGPDPALRQAFVNILADMSVAPTTLQVRWGLIRAERSRDTVPPRSRLVEVVDRLDDATAPRVTVVAMATDTPHAEKGGSESSDGRDGGLGSPRDRVDTIDETSGDRHHVDMVETSGTVAGVEVSLDGGQRFHPMTMTTTGAWVYTWGLGPADIIYDDPRVFKRVNSGVLDVRVRAVDDSLNMETAHGRRSEEDGEQSHSRPLGDEL